jgi:hypothetical protein
MMALSMGNTNHTIAPFVAGMEFGAKPTYCNRLAFVFWVVFL